MLFYSYQFFIFLPAVLLLYFVIPRKCRAVWLLIASYVFYACFSVKALLILLAVTAASYFTGIRLEQLQGKEAEKKKKRFVFWAGAGTVLAVLFLFKYTGFFLESLNMVTGRFGAAPLSLPFSLILPAGISYFTFQMISYLADIYMGKIQAEHNFLYYALYISFFPKIIVGPIERADFLNQIRACSSFSLWDFGRITEGISRMAWGYFEKLVIADRLSLLTGTVFSDYQSFGSTELFVAAAAFYIQLYADFAGCIDMAAGMAKIMGFKLTENFRAPFFAKTVREYWARWHLSLGTWLRDYVYIPLGGNRKGTLKRYRNLMITFFVSGIWHGAAWHFIMWGLLQGICEIGDDIARPIITKVNNKLHTKTESFGYRLVRTVKCWLVVCFTIVVFKMPTVRDGFQYLWHMFTRWNPWALFDGSLYTLGITEKYMHVVIVAVIILLLVDWLKYKRELTFDCWLSAQCIWFRYLTLLGCILAVVLFGVYGPSYSAENFIYFQF